MTAFIKFNVYGAFVIVLVDSENETTVPVTGGPRYVARKLRQLGINPDNVQFSPELLNSITAHFILTEISNTEPQTYLFD